MHDTRYSKLIFEWKQIKQQETQADRSFKPESNDTKFISVSKMDLELWIFKYLIFLCSFMLRFKTPK